MFFTILETAVYWRADNNLGCMDQNSFMVCWVKVFNISIFNLLSCWSEISPHQLWINKLCQKKFSKFNSIESSIIQVKSQGNRSSIWRSSVLKDGFLFQYMILPPFKHFLSVEKIIRSSVASIVDVELKRLKLPSWVDEKRQIESKKIPNNWEESQKKGK